MTTPLTTPLDGEDDKLVTLARAAAGRIGASGAGAVRDEDGRSYASASIDLPSLSLSGLQLAVAQAAAAGAASLEAAVFLGAADDAGAAAVRDLAASAPIYAVDGSQVRRLGA